jgi:mevalonate kinase
VCVSRSHGCSSKLTGAGGGGCGFTLLQPSMSPAAVDALAVDLRGHGFECFETTAGGPGVLFHAAGVDGSSDSSSGADSGSDD